MALIFSKKAISLFSIIMYSVSYSQSKHLHSKVSTNLGSGNFSIAFIFLDATRNKFTHSFSQTNYIHRCQ